MLRNFAIAAGLFAAGTTSVAAHHSFAAAYDMSESITITGTIVNVRLTNPHSYFFLDVENAAGDKVVRVARAVQPCGQPVQRL